MPPPERHLRPETPAEGGADQAKCAAIIGMTTCWRVCSRVMRTSVALRFCSGASTAPERQADEPCPHASGIADTSIANEHWRCGAVIYPTTLYHLMEARRKPKL